MDTDVRSFEDLTRSLSGLAEYTVVDAHDSAGPGLSVTVRRSRADAACPAYGEFSFRVKSCSTSTVRDATCRDFSRGLGERLALTADRVATERPLGHQ